MRGNCGSGNAPKKGTPKSWKRAMASNATNALMLRWMWTTASRSRRQRSTPAKTTASASQCAASTTPCIRSKFDQMLRAALTPKSAATREQAKPMPNHANSHERGGR